MWIHNSVFHTKKKNVRFPPFGVNFKLCDIIGSLNEYRTSVNGCNEWYVQY